METMFYDKDIEVDSFENKETVVLNLDFTSLTPYGDFENLTADAYIEEIELDLNDLKEIKNIVDHLNDPSEVGFCEKVMESIETLEDLGVFEKMEKYSFDFDKTIIDKIENLKNSERIDIENTESVVESLQKALEAMEKYLYNEYNGLDLEDSYADDCIREASDNYHPMMNSAWKLEQEPTHEDIKKILDNTPNISIIKMGDDHYVTMNGAGFDMSQSIAYAYLTIDENIPKDLMSERSDMSQPYSGNIEALNEVRKYFGKEPLREEDSIVQNVDRFIEEREDQSQDQSLSL